MEFARDLSTHFKRWLTALDVTTFDDLCDLMILEQFKNCLPERMAKYITEQKVTSAADAAVSADEYVLLHKSSFRERSVARDGFAGRGNGSDASFDMCCAKKVGLRSDMKVGGTSDSGNICNYCHEKGHWKAECPVLKAKSKGMRTSVKPAASVAPVKDCCVSEVLTSHSGELDVLAAYAPFIRDGFVSLVGSDVRVPIKILRDTGAYDSYIVDSVLPLSGETDTGDRVLSCGMGLRILPVSLHKVIIDCELVKGEVAVGVRPALPIEGAHFILG